MVRVSQILIVFFLSSATSAVAVCQDANLPVPSGEERTGQDGEEIDLSSPEAAWKTYREAHLESRYDVTYEAFAPVARPEFVVRLASSARKEIPYEDREGRAALDQLADDYGAPRSLTALFVKQDAKSPQQQSDIVEAAYRRVRDEKAYVEKVTRLIKDHREASKPADDTQESFSEKLDRLRRESFSQIRMQNIRIDGDIATADAVSPNGNTHQRKFRRVGERWHIDYDWSQHRHDFRSKR